jgi:Transcriptional regulator
VIVAAAAGLFWSRGYAGTSLADIAEAAGVPSGNMFYYFRTKAEIARAVADVFVEETAGLVAEAQTAEAEPERRVRYLIERLARSNRTRMEKGCPIALAVRDFRAPAPDASARAAESFERLIAFLAQEFGRAGLKPSQALSQARALIAEWQGGIALAHAFGDMTVLSESFRRAGELVRRIFATAHAA